AIRRASAGKPQGSRPVATLSSEEAREPLFAERGHDDAEARICVGAAISSEGSVSATVRRVLAWLFSSRRRRLAESCADGSPARRALERRSRSRQPAVVVAQLRGLVSDARARPRAIGFGR